MIWFSGFPQDKVITAEIHTNPPQVSYYSSESDSDIEDSPSAYEKAAMKWREENRQLLKKLGFICMHVAMYYHIAMDKLHQMKHD